jgi:hypothetical protein
VAEVVDVVEAMMKLEYPGLRWDVIAEVESLADADYPQQAWLQGNNPADKQDDLRLVFNILLDDTPVCADPDYWSGVNIFPSEVEPLRTLGQVLMEMRDDLGEAVATTYLRDPRWARVVEAAQIALAAARENDARYPQDPLPPEPAEAE